MKAIAAINNGGYIGLDGKLPWRSSADFKHFKEKTKGAICIIGKVTFEQDLGGKGLPGRIMVVVGTNPNPDEYIENVHYKPNLWQAVKHSLAVQQYWANWDHAKDIWVIGGASIYNQLWPLITELHLSIINDDTVGDRKLDIPENFRGTIFKYHFEPNKKETV